MADAGYNTSVVMEQGGSALRVKSGGTIVADNGGVLDMSAANAADVKLPAGAVTLPKVNFTGIKTLKGVGAAAAGAVTLTGTAVGDRVVSIIGNLTAGGPLLVFVPGTDFEATISVINQIQQLSASDLHLTTIVVTLAPAQA
jgi:hypothetical protein